MRELLTMLNAIEWTDFAGTGEMVVRMVTSIDLGETIIIPQKIEKLLGRTFSKASDIENDFSSRLAMAYIKAFGIARHLHENEVLQIEYEFLAGLKHMEKKCVHKVFFADIEDGHTSTYLFHQITLGRNALPIKIPMMILPEVFAGNEFTEKESEKFQQETKYSIVIDGILPFTFHELDVLKAIAYNPDATIKAIAGILRITVDGVKYHYKKIMLSARENLSPLLDTPKAVALYLKALKLL